MILIAYRKYELEKVHNLLMKGGGGYGPPFINVEVSGDGTPGYLAVRSAQLSHKIIDGQHIVYVMLPHPEGSGGE